MPIQLVISNKTERQTDRQTDSGTLDRLVGKEDVDDIETGRSRVIRHTTSAVSDIATLYVGFAGALY